MVFLLRLTIFNILYIFGSWRWVLLGILFALITAYTTTNISRDRLDTKVVHNINAWDVAANMLSNGFSLRWVYIFGFLFLIGDSLLKEQQQGLLALSLSRIGSRRKWWWGKVVSLGILALIYVIAGLIIILAISSFSVPFSFSNSLDAQSGKRLADGDWYFFIKGIANNDTWSTPWLVIGASLYTAFGLWIISCLVIVFSALVQNSITVLGVILLWLLFGLFIPSSFYENYPYLMIVDLGYIPFYGKHSYQLYNVSLLGFMLISLIILVLIIKIGEWRLKQLDL